MKALIETTERTKLELSMWPLFSDITVVHSPAGFGKSFAQ